MDEKEYMKRVAEIDIDQRGPLPPYEDPSTLTRRDRFAMAALTGLLSNGLVKNMDGPNDVAGLAYELASAMELARNKEGGE